VAQSGSALAWGARGPEFKSRRSDQSFRACPRIGGWTTVLLAVAASTLQAQQSPQPPVTSASDRSAASAADESAPALNSTEQGRVAMSDSFKSRRERITEERRQAWQDTLFTWQLRTIDMYTINADDSRSAAWALGGAAGFQTGFFRNLFSFGATGYTSQPIYAPSDESGTNLLKPNQNGYTVLGEAFAQFRITDTLDLTVGRRGLDTPFISRNDTRMTPQTFEAVALQGTAGELEEEGILRYGAGYVDKEKQVNSDDFVNMAQVAGASVDRGVYVAGASYKTPGWSLGAMEYYSEDIINIAATEGTYVIPLAETRRVNLFAQYIAQHSTGMEALPGGYFSTSQFGMKAELATGPALLTIAYTGTAGGASMRSPWSGYPGYTSVQVLNFDLAGENAFMLRAACNVEAIPGFSVYGLWVRGSTSQPPTPQTQDEYDANLQWSPPQSSSLRGVMFRMRYAVVTQTNAARQSQLRLMLFYTPPTK
jgi:outer membrane porin, OprD family